MLKKLFELKSILQSAISSQAPKPPIEEGVKATLLCGNVRTRGEVAHAMYALDKGSVPEQPIGMEGEVVWARDGDKPTGKIFLRIEDALYPVEEDEIKVIDHQNTPALEINNS